MLSSFFSAHALLVALGPQQRMQARRDTDGVWTDMDELHPSTAIMCNKTRP